ncbi:MAG: Neutral/alkaline non-lysosomal ceramidase [Verrucomicrobiales bacterium]|nr:Neutral/alkaline non-lysosomal ceramidase [Verrucomicrobiales bacterium]
MKSNFWRQRALILLLVIVSKVLNSHAEFRSGAAMRIVTPAPLLPVSGGVGPSHATERKLGELTVRALVLEEGTNRVAIVGADFLGFPSVLGDKVRARVSGITPRNILIGSTHTHSAPDCYGFPDEKGGFSVDLKYLDSVCEKMADAIDEAVEKLQPSTLKIGSGEAKGKIAYNYYAPQLYDPRCSVMQTIGMDGMPIATLVNYAIHPEVIGSDQKILSPDLVGPLCDRLAEQGGGLGIFLNSAQGGMVTADCRGPDGKDIRTWDECLRIGNLLADESMRILRQAAVQSAPHLFCTNRMIRFQVDSSMMRQIMKLSPLGYKNEQEGSVLATINLINLGNAQFLTIPGEALPNIGYFLKRKMKGKHQFLFGLTNDAFGYILTKVDFNSFKRYEYVSRTSLGEMTGETYINEALDLVEHSPAP